MRTITTLASTIKQTEQTVATLRATLHETALAGRTEDLHAITLAIAKAEANLGFLTQASIRLETAAWPFVLASLHRQLYSGPDDGWSGTSNPVRRASFKGKLEAVEELEELVELNGAF